MSTVGQVKLLASSIDVTTEVHSEVKTKSQVKITIAVTPSPSEMTACYGPYPKKRSFVPFMKLLRGTGGENAKKTGYTDIYYPRSNISPVPFRAL